MDVLVEVHDGDELERALRHRQRSDRHQQPQPQDAGGRPRDHRAAGAAVPTDRVLVAESGLGSPADLAAHGQGRGLGLPDRRELHAQARRRRGDARGCSAGGGMSEALTHFDAAGNAHMVDVGAKDETERVATARGQRADGSRRPWPDRDRQAPRATCWRWRSSPASWRPSAPPT